jgi:mRNA interferase MazF
VIARGSIHWMQLGEAHGSAPAKLRPVLVVQSDSFNSSKIGTAIVATITSNTQLAQLPGNVFVPASASGLPKDSVVNLSQLVTADKTDLFDHVGQLPHYLVDEVDVALRRVLAL